MKTKVVVGVLLLVACISLLAVKGVSQLTDNKGQPLPPPAAEEGSLEQLVQQLMALEVQEEELLKKINLKVEERRQALQRAKQIRQAGKRPVGKDEIQRPVGKDKMIEGWEKDVKMPDKMDSK